MKLIAYWVTTIIGPASFVIGGFGYLTRGEQMIEMINHLGYPVYFMTILGVAKILGAITVVIPGFPRLKEWAYAGFFFLLSSAALSHAFTGDSITQIIQPLFFLLIVLASWALRPSNRKLATHHR